MNYMWLLVGILVLALLALIFAYPKPSPSSASLQDTFLQATQAPSLVPPSKQPVSIGPTNVLELETGDDADGFLAQGPGILMVYATWCGHCKHMMPSFDQASTQTNVKFARIEGHKAPQFMQKHGIRGFPTLLTVNKNNELGRHMGGRDIASLLGSANSLVNPPVVVATPPTDAAPASAPAPAEAPAPAPEPVAATPSGEAVAAAS